MRVLSGCMFIRMERHTVIQCIATITFVGLVTATINMHWMYRSSNHRSQRSVNRRMARVTKVTTTLSADEVSDAADTANIASVIQVDRPQPSCSIYNDFMDFPDVCELQYKNFLRIYPYLPHMAIDDHNKHTMKALVRTIKSHRYDVKVQDILQPMHPSTMAALRNVLTLNGTVQRLNVLVLQVSETIKNVATQGGSGFRIMSYSKVIRYCGYRDHFNGLYTVYCIMAGHCTDVVLQLSHIQYNQYKGYSRSNDHVVWRGTVCLKETAVTASNKGCPGLPIQKVEDFHSAISYHGLWHGNRENHTFMANSGTYFPVEKSFMCSCINTTRLVVVGASHLRNAMYCTHRTCAFKRVMRHSHYVSETYMADVVHSMRNNYTVHSKVDPDRSMHIILQTGSWDLAFTDFSSTLGKTLETLEQELSEFIKKVLKKHKDHSLTILNLPALPNRSSHPLKLVSRNSEISAVFNKRLRRMSSRLGVQYVDMFSVTFPFNRESTMEYGMATHHYVNARCIGRIGQVTTELMFHTICPTLSQRYNTGGDFGKPP